jgi:hypothetical protein
MPIPYGMLDKAFEQGGGVFDQITKDITNKPINFSSQKDAFQEMSENPTSSNYKADANSREMSKEQLQELVATTAKEHER